MLAHRGPLLKSRHELAITLCSVTSKAPQMRNLARWLDHRLHYAWVVLAVTVLVLLAVAGIRAASSVMIIPLEQDFGWSRDEVSGSLAVGLLIFGLAAPFAAALMQRFGVRMVVSV